MYCTSDFLREISVHYCILNLKKSKLRWAILPESLLQPQPTFAPTSVFPTGSPGGSDDDGKGDCCSLTASLHGRGGPPAHRRPSPCKTKQPQTSRELHLALSSRFHDEDAQDLGKLNHAQSAHCKSTQPKRVMLQLVL